MGAIALSVRVDIEDGLLLAVMFVIALQIIVVASSAISTRFRRRRHIPELTRAAPATAAIGDNRIQVFTYGMDLYRAMLRDVRSAQSSICLESFIWKGDRIGSEFKQALIAKAEAGVPVYVVFDGFANLVVSRVFKRFPPLVHTYRYRGWRRVLDVIDPRRLARDHRKLLTIDERIAYIGGYNIGDLYGARWRDTHARIEGPAATDAFKSFADFWREHAGEDDAPAGHLPVVRDPRIRLYINNPTRIIFPIRAMYIDAIDHAEDRVFLTTPYFVPDRFVLASLVRAAKRGVQVNLIVPERSNHLLADWLARTYFTDCLAQGIRIYLYQNAMIHAKTATIDGKWSTIGTANLDRLSLIGNHEINVEFFDDSLAHQMEWIFQRDIEHCRELHLQEWEHRPLAQKLGELVLSPYWPFL